MDMRPGGSVIRQELFSMCVLRGLGFGVSVPLGQRTQWVLPSRGTETAVWSGLCRIVLDLRGYLTTWCDRPKFAHPGNEDRKRIVRQVL